MSIFKPHFDGLEAYKPPLEGRDNSQFTLLDFNERTIPVAPIIIDALVSYLHSGKLQQYPSYGTFTEQLANYAGVQSNQVMITNGSDQGIDLIFRAACNPGDQVIIPTPSFAIYNQCAAIENLEIIAPNYQKDIGFPFKDTLAFISDKTRLIVIANPNNPSGTAIESSAIEQIAKAAPNAGILVDECYFEYSQATIADKIDQYPNLIITRTFSKTWGLPSLRLGYVISNASNIQTLLKIRGPYDINQLALIAGSTALDNPEYTLQYVDEVMKQAKPLLESALIEMGVDFWPSTGNFLWVFPKSADSIEQELRKNQVLVRPKKDYEGRLGLRITVGTVPQTEKLIKILSKFL